MTYLKEGHYIYLPFDLPSQRQLIIRARNVHKDRTGVHASIELLCRDSKSPDIVLAWGFCNTERDEDRTRLARSALKHASDEDTNSPIKHRLDLFCHGLWDEYLQSYTAEEMIGAEVLTSPCYFVKPFVVHEGGTILFGPPKRGKSITALLMAVSVNSGVNKIWPVTLAKTLYINLERPAKTIRQRLARVNEFLGLPLTTPLLTFNARGKRLADIADNIHKVLLDHDVDFIVLDSLSRAGYGSMIKDEEVNKCLDTLNGFNKTYLALGHSPRSTDEHILGSQMYDAAADVIVRLTSAREANKLGIVLKVLDANDIPTDEVRKYVLEFDDVGFKLIRSMQSFEFPDLRETDKYTLKEEVQAYLDEVGKASATIIAKALDKNRSNISTLLSHGKDFVRLDKEGKEVLYGNRFKL